MTAVQAMPPASWHVVIIDDSPDDRAEVRRLLLRGAERRYAFAEVDTGAAGVNLVLAMPNMPDCVVLDFNLPDMDALEVLARLAGPGGLPVCPIVVLTGGNELAAGRTVLRAGAQDYIAKDGLTPLALTRILENARERLAMAREFLAQTTALQRTEKKLSEADRRKDEFIATLAHELRNPLAPIATGLQVLRMAKDGAAPPILDIMERQLQRMTRLIDDLMEIARIKNGKMSLRPRRVLLSMLIEEAAEAAVPLIAAAQHTLRIDVPPQPIWLDVDPTRIVQVIGNLLNNSVKYSANGSHITLSAYGEGGEAIIQVTDTGMGIPEDMLSHVFDMFAQVNNTLQRTQGGLGIGLALVKQIVELHNGTVVARSAGAGQGSTFLIRLAIAGNPLELVTGLAAELPMPPGARRILVVDDNVDGAEMLSMRLGISGHVVRTVFSGEEALAVIAWFSPEIVFLDLGLPGMNGYQVARHFRATPGLKDALIVALTGWGGEDDRRKSREAGFDLHLTKPVESSVVDAVISQYVAVNPRTAAV
jgi:signal transduction histidine kinase